MKRYTLLLALLLQTFCLVFGEDVSIYDMQPGHDYYIWNTYYERALGPNADNTQPRLSIYTQSKDEQYIFTAIAAPTPGYVLLKHKLSGKYVTASTSNNYSVVFQDNSGSSNVYQWQVRPTIQGQLVNKKNTSAALGVDKDESSDYIGVWYDKSQDVETSCFQVFESNGQGLESSRKAWAVKELRNIHEYISGELTNTSYPLLYRNKLPSSLAVISAWMQAPEQKTANEMLDKAIVLRDSLGLMTSFESNVLLTSTEMESFKSTFSLGLAHLQMNEKYPGDSIHVILRNKQGRGLRYTISANGEYAFVYENEQVKIYKNGNQIASKATYYVPKYTAQDTDAEWTIIRKSRLTSCQPEILSESSVVTKSGQTVTDKWGNPSRSVISLTDCNLVLDQQIDFHIINEEKPLTNCKISLDHEQAWLIFDNTLPSVVVSKYLPQILINGAAAKENENCRVVIYLNGALVMPYKKNGQHLICYEGEQYTGASKAYSVGAYTDLGKDCNRYRSMRLKRGYMMTLASSKSGKGYSRVYVADHSDLEIPVLPKALYGRISSITIKKWQYVSKKGWCSTTSNSAIATECKKMRATWFYTWGADRASTYDTEYVPIRQHIWWPSMSAITKQDATACLSLNEPDHSEQHNNCDCKGTISPWTACTYTPDFQQTGMRIGSPAPTDAGWLKEYIGHCNDMSYRCDFVAFHAYWGTNEAADAKAWYNRLKSIYDATKRPIWITEWNNGASWTSESWPSGYNDKLEKQRKAIKEIINVLDTCSFVERYAIYNWDTYYRAMINWDDGNVLPAGKVYRDSKSDFAYNAKVQFTPVWWTPSLKTPTLTARINDIDQHLALTIVNPNNDVTDILAIQRYDNQDHTWKDYYTEDNRYLFDNDTLRYTFPLADFDLNDTQLRVYIKRTVGDEAYSPASTTSYIVNPNVYASSKTEVDGWTCQKSAQNGYTKATGDTYFEVWSPTAQGQQFDYYQTLTDLPQGVYELSAVVFNSTDKVASAKVNGSVVLYAQADTIQYLMPVTEDSEINYDKRLVIPGIIVLDGKMQIGVKNLGEMTARWAGADDFKLVRTGDLETDSHQQYMATRALHQEHNLAMLPDLGEGKDATAYIVNPSCQRSDAYGWVVTNNGVNTGEASDGNSSNAYWNLWKGSAYTSTMDQDITFLPEGKYAVQALLRGSADANIKLTIKNTSQGEQMSSKAETIGNTGGIGNQGWVEVTTPYVIIRPGDTLRISFSATLNSGWWSADDFRLLWNYVEPLPDKIEDIPLQPQRSNAAYNLQGIRATKPQHGVYIIHGKKVIL